MTDTTIPSTELAEADIRETAERLGFDPSDVRELLAALNVPMQAEPKPLPTEPGSVIIATEVRGVTGKWRMLLDDDGEWSGPESIGGWGHHCPDRITAWIEAVVLPAGKKIDPDDVREGDLVRLELDSGDEATFTVTGAGRDFLISKYNVFPITNIRTIHLLHREEA